MKVICRPDELTKATQAAMKATSSKSSNPLLSGIYLSAAADKLSLQATDYSLAIGRKIDANVMVEGFVLVSGKLLLEAVRKLKGESVTLETKDTKLTVKCGKTQYSLMTMENAETFPSITVPRDDVTRLSFNAIDFIDMVSKTAFACSADEGRPIFTGCHICIDENGAAMAATNTHRLAICKSNHTADRKINVIIPAPALREVADIIPSDSQVTMLFHRQQVYFIAPDTLIKTRTIDGSFPDYARIIPNSFTSRATVDTKEFLQAIERISFIAKDDQVSIVTFAFEKGEVNLAAVSTQFGEATDSVVIDFEGAPLKIGFNAAYFLDALKTMPEKFVIELTTNLSAAKIYSPNNDSHLYVVTPVRINGN